MTPEEEARQEIDRLLQAAGWQVQDYNNLNLGAASGGAVREFPLESGRADYLLFVDRIAVGAIEAKPEGTILTDAEGQTERYLRGIPENIPHFQDPCPSSSRAQTRKYILQTLEIQIGAPGEFLLSSGQRPCMIGSRKRIP